MSGFIIPVDFPDYTIGEGRVPYTGHSGIIIVDDKGNAIYYEYGENHGNGTVAGDSTKGYIRSQNLGKVQVDASGNITPDSLAAALAKLQGTAGSGTIYEKDTGVIVVAPQKATDAEVAAAQAKVDATIAAVGSGGTGQPYSVTDHNCLDFVYDVAAAGGKTVTEQQSQGGVAYPAGVGSDFIIHNGGGYKFYGPNSTIPSHIDPATYDNYLDTNLVNDARAMADKAYAKDALDIIKILLMTVAQAQMNPSSLITFLLSIFSAEKKHAPEHYEPLVLDLSGNGIKTTPLSLGASFDLNNNGFAQLTSWVQSGTGILVNDPTDGAITNGSQMFGTSTSLIGGGYASDGFSALADLDSNHDGVINSSDTAWSGLRLWVDSDGTAGSGRIITLATAGISSISLSSTNANVTDANGDVITKTATYTKTAGGTGQVADLNFITSPSMTTPTMTVAVSPTISALPDLIGFGTVNSLQQTMQIQLNAGSSTLETYVQSFVSATTDTSRNTLADQIIIQWTGVSGISPTSRGSYFDAQKLTALEKLSGTPFIDPYGGTSNPTAQSVAALTAAYQQLHDYILAGLESQTNLQSLFSQVTISQDSPTANPYANFTTVQAQIISDLSANRTAGLAELSNFNLALHTRGLDQGPGFIAFRTALFALGSDVGATFPGGTSVINGTAGSDVITAWAGNQTIIASQGGNDTLISGAGNVTIYGSSGSNTFIGGVGNNQVFWGGNDNNPFFGGTAGTSDTFIAGTGTQTFRESAWGSVDVYYAAGNGNVTIDNFTIHGPHGSINLDSSITRSALNISVSGNDLIMTDGTAGDTLTIKNRGVIVLNFADGSTIDLTKVGNTYHPTAGTTATGSASFDDLYFYNKSTGSVTLSDTGGNNTLYTGAGITRDNIMLTASGANLLIADGVSGDQITVLNRGVQTLQFADGTTLSLLAAGTNYTLGAGTLTGTTYNDTYTYARGTGAAVISDPGGVNALALSGSISLANLAYYSVGSDLVITDALAGDKITVSGQLGTRPIISTLTLPSGGGTVNLLAGLNMAMGSGQTLLTGTTGSDTLTGAASGAQTITGNGGNDIFIAGTGTSTLNGGTGNDTYSFISGHGLVTISDAGGNNALTLGTGLNAVTLTGSGNDLIITDGVAGDTITLKNQLGISPPLSQLVLGNGTTQALIGISLTPASGVTTLYGTFGDDTLNAGAGNKTLITNGGNDTLIGGSGTQVLIGNTYGGNDQYVLGGGVATVYAGSGDDIFSYAAGKGLLTVNEGGGHNTIALAAGLTAANITLAASGSDLLITDGTAGDTITLKNQLSQNVQVDAIRFSDSSTKSLVGITLTAGSGAASLNGTSGNDLLTGSSGTQILNGNGGNDTFITGGGTATANGGLGNDIYSYTGTKGLWTINDTGGTNTLVLGSGITKSNVALKASGNDLIITDGIAGDTITLKNQLSGQWGISTLVYPDATTLALEGLALTMPAAATLLNGTPGNDTLTATAGTETLAGNGGSDKFIGATGNQTFIGSAGNDTFTGGTGTQVMTGNGGNDVFTAAIGVTSVTAGTGNDLYSYSSGNGTLVLGDTGGTDTLKLGTGLTSSNVSLIGSGNDLLITDGTAGDQIKVVGQFTSSTSAVDTLIYGNGTTTSLTSALKIYASSGTSTLNATSGADTLIGTTGNQTLNGKGGADTFIGGTGTQVLFGNQATNGNNVFIAATGVTTAYGGTGNDMYSFSSGNGALVINETSGTDTLKLGTGLTAANVVISETSNGNDLLITDGVGGDQIQIVNGGLPTSYGVIVETLIYGDGTSIALGTNMTLKSQTGNATLNGSAGNDTLIAVNGTGTETLNGFGGNDVYSYSSGNGLIVIGDTTGTDTLKLGTGLTAANIVMSETSNGNDLLLTDGVSGDQIQIINGGLPTSYGTIVETLIYGDGSTAVLGTNMTLKSQTGNATLNGSAGNDTLIAVNGTGTETLNGFGGNDVYSYSSGNGLVVINDTLGNDTLKLGTGLTAANVTLTGSGNDLFITDGVAGDQIKLARQTYNPAYAIDTLIYGDGSTVNLGTAPVTAAAGNTTLNGTTANNVLIGSTGNQTINGNGGSDYFVGGTGTQTLNGHQGTNGNNVFIAATGTTTAIGGSGNDLYSYTSGNGTLVITENGGTDTLQLGAGLTAANVIVSASSDGHDVVITDGVSGDLITVVGGDLTSYALLETLIYGDGTTATLNTNLNLKAATGNSTVNGTSGNDTLIAVNGTGTETLLGSTGNDTYSYSSGNGLVVISESSGGSGTDTLKLGTGLTASNVVLTEASNGYDLLITDGVAGDQVKLTNQYYSSAYTVETLVYGDGSTLNIGSGVKLIASAGTSTLNGTAGSDTLIGSTGTQTITGNGGGDYFIGGTGTQILNGNVGTTSNTFIAAIGKTTANGGLGNDTYSYSSGNGTLVINDSGGTDTLKLGVGLTAANIVVSVANGTDLLITDGVAGDLITILAADNNVSRQIETLIYGDGTTTTLNTNQVFRATSGNSTVNGTSGNDTLIAVNGTGTETLIGSTGNDTYSYTSGNGLVVINESSGGSGTDVLRLAPGLTASNVVLTEGSNGYDLVITDGVSGDQITIINQYYSAAYTVETLIYGDNTALSLSSGVKLMAAPGTSTLNGTSGSDTLIASAGTQHINNVGGGDTFIGGSGTEWLNGTQGTNGNNVFIIGTGLTTINGGIGNDIFSFSSGSGTAVISDNGGTDTLKLGTGLTSANVFFTTDSTGADLIITDSTSGDQIQMKSQSNASFASETLIYGDGTTLALNSVKFATSAATTLNGTTGNDILIPNTGNLTLAGAGGTDVYDFGRGMGHDVINNGIAATNTAFGTLDFGHGIGKDQLWFDRVDGTGAISATGNNLRITVMGTSSYVTINDEFNATNVYRHLTGFAVSDTGYKLDSQLNNLVSAMATFETNYASSHGGTAYDPTNVANTSITDTTVLAAVNSDWHS